MKAGRWSWVGLGCALGLALVAYGSVLGSDRRSASDEASGELEAGAGRLSKSDLRSPGQGARPESGDDGHGDSETPRRSSGNEVQPEDEAWDELSDIERKKRLEDDFSSAVEEIQAGGRSPHLVAQAEGALSELRAQMYSTAIGRKEHQALEERLSAVTEDQKDDDVDEEK